jgi:hypothetical protein
VLFILVEGSACNPALSHDECNNAPTIQCIWPTNPARFGQAYCCNATPNFDANGNFLGTYVITSTDPNCASLAACQNRTGGETSTTAPEASTSEASMPEATTTEGSTPEASMPEASSSEASTPEASMEETGPD